METAASNQELLELANSWLKSDPDPETSAELEALLASNDFSALQQLFAGRLEFGTAGLRAELGAGPLRMNQVVVAQTTAGLARFLLRRKQAGEIAADVPQVVIGFDGRKNSKKFAVLTARVLAGYGLDAVLLPGPAPTPVTAFAVRHYKAAAGVMITASHNPPQYNGYKLYLGDADNGSQVTIPHDRKIAAEIAAVAEEDFQQIPQSSSYRVGDDFLWTEYIAATLTSTLDHEQLAFLQDTSPLKSQPKIVYTALHGVGATITQKLFAAANLPQLVTVAAQNSPDETFPTVDFPNPEEPGALDLAYQLASEINADLVIAHDPDADRLAVALPDRDGTGYKMLSGNQLGLLLGWQSAIRASKSNLAAKPALACTIVSSPALKAVAAHYGFEYQETLSGFKWVSRVPNLCFGFEEALGYLVNPGTVRDKDGISASLLLTSYACELFSEGKTLWDALDAAAELFGSFASKQITLRFKTVQEAQTLLEKLRNNPPTIIDTVQVASFTDLQNSPSENMRGNVLRFDLVDGSRIMARPSGTEPKLKIYIDAYANTGTAQERDKAAQSKVERLNTAMTEIISQL